MAFNRGWLLLAVAVPSLAAAQGRGVVRGAVFDQSGRALQGAQITVIGLTGSGETDDVGTFEIAGLKEAPSQLVVRRLGFAPETLLVRPSAGGGTSLHVRLRRIVQPLEAVVVRGRRDATNPMSGFYQRMERGMGRYFTQAQIERRNVSRMSDLLRDIPGMRIGARRSGAATFRIRGAVQAPLVWLDGTPMSSSEIDLDAFDPRSFEGIEVYSGTSTTPTEFAGGRGMSSSSGTIVLWTRRGEPRGPRRKKGAPTPPEVVAQMLERGEAFTAIEVASPVSTLGSLPITPAYPDSLFAARLGGEVEVEFVVLATGRVRPETFSVISSTHPLLGDAVRRAVLQQLFVPATRGGRAVAQLVHLPFSFVPDTELASRKPED